MTRSLSAGTLTPLRAFKSPKRFAVRYLLVPAALARGLPAGAAAARRPAIAGTDVLSGKHVALSQFKGKPVFVSVWGSWCDGCKTEAPTLARFVKANSRRVAFLGINTEDSKQGARAFAARYGLRYPSVWDPRGLLAGEWSRGAPTTLVFDRRHVFVKRIEGTATLRQLNAALKQVTT
jgi:thiol-disulfide isomerase/thioredoxin